MADNNFPTPGGATAPGYVPMALDSSGRAVAPGSATAVTPAVLAPQAPVTETTVAMDGTWKLAWTAAPAKRVIIGFPSDGAASGDYSFNAALAGTTTSAGIPFAAGAGGSFDFSGGPPPNTSIYVKGTAGKSLTVQVFN